jgi:hypothetical protein
MPVLSAGAVVDALVLVIVVVTVASVLLSLALEVASLLPPSSQPMHAP